MFHEVKIVNLTVKTDIYYIEKNNITVTVADKKKKKVRVWISLLYETVI